MRKAIIMLAVLIFWSGIGFSDSDVWSEAKLIKPQGEPVVIREDYFSAYHGNPCDFNTDGDFERIVEFGDGIVKRGVASGVLAFKTGKENNFFYFGRHLFPKGPKDAPDENICFGDPMLGMFEFRMRMKQSNPESHLRISMRRAEGNEQPGKELSIISYTKPDTLLVKGTEWQDVVVDFNKSSRHPYRTLCIAFEGEDNAVQIDSIELNLVKRPVYFRKRLVLSATPVYATLQLWESAPYDIYVNGRLVHSCPGYDLVNGDRVIDVSKTLHKGENVIAIGVENTANRRYQRNCLSRLAWNGVALLEDGAFVPLRSDESWQGSWQVEQGWADATSSEKWNAVEVVSPKTRVMSGPVQYAGPLQVQLEGDPVYDIKEGVDLPIVLPKGYKTQYTLTNSFTRTETAKGGLSIEALSETLDTHHLRFRPGKPGVWEVGLTLTDPENKVVADRVLEVAVTGPIPQKKVKGLSYTEGMELKKLLTIDCVNDTTHHLFHYERRGATTSAVVNASMGSYRESEDRAYAGFGYVFSVNNLYKPHLIEIEYPDDAMRRMFAWINCVPREDMARNPQKYDWIRGDRQYHRWYTGAITGGYEFPVSNTFKKMYMIFWPSALKDGNVLVLMPAKHHMRAAAKSITVYEIDDLPALDLPDTPGRLFGMYIERESITPSHFYTGEFYDLIMGRPDQVYRDWLGRLRDWYITYENLIKYLRFTGQNVYVPGYQMYRSLHFPEWGNRGLNNNIPEDHFQLMASMFEANGLYLMLGWEYESSLALEDAIGPTNWEVRHRQADTAQAVSRLGTQSAVTYSDFVDYQDSLVKDDVRKAMDVCMKYSRDFPCVKGVVFNTRSGNYPCLTEVHGGRLKSSLAWGWQDSAVEAFEQATGLKIPVDANDPDRFQERHDYVTSHPDVLDQWLDFRCRNVRDGVMDLSQHIAKRRPDWKLYINQVFPLGEERIKMAAGDLSYAEAMRIRGFDKNVWPADGFVVNVLEAGRDGRGMMALPGDVADQRWEYWGEPEGLYFSRWFSAHNFDSVATEPYTAWAYALGLAQCTPSVITFAQMDNAPDSGGEQRFRPFVKAYRSLPAGTYKTLRGEGLDQGIAIRTLEGGGCFYVVNPFRFAVKTVLTVSEDAALLDAVTNEPVAGKDGEIALELAPYDVKVFKGKGRPVRATTEAGERAAEFVRSRVGVLLSFAQRPVDEAARLAREWELNVPVEELMETLRNLERTFNDGDLLSALKIMDRDPLRAVYDHSAKKK